MHAACPLAQGQLKRAKQSKVASPSKWEAITKKERFLTTPQQRFK
jgi:hypothetical protein